MKKGIPFFLLALVIGCSNPTASDFSVDNTEGPAAIELSALIGVYRGTGEKGCPVSVDLTSIPASPLGNSPPGTALYSLTPGIDGGMENPLDQAQFHLGRTDSKNSHSNTYLSGSSLIEKILETHTSPGIPDSCNETSFHKEQWAVSSDGQLTWTYHIEVVSPCNTANSSVNDQTCSYHRI